MKKAEEEKRNIRKIQQGKNVATSQQAKEQRATEYLQRHIRGLLARKEI